MRSVFLYLKSALHADVTQYLNSHFVQQGGDNWIFREVLYIEFYADAAAEFEPEEYAALRSQLGRDDFVAIVADVSGRVDGRDEVFEFCSEVLSHYEGYAMDDYSRHLWTLDEIRSRQCHMKHPFFDHDGWFAERKLRTEES